MTTILNIPFKRPLYPPSYVGEKTLPGDDVLGVKRMTSRMGFWPWGEFDPVYYEGFAKGQRNKLGRLIKGREGVVGLQRYLGVKDSGYYGKTTHVSSTQLRIRDDYPHAREFAWDQTAINLYKGFEDHTPSESLVADIFEWWDWMVNHEPSIHYDQGRPISILAMGKKPPTLPYSDDCSGTFIGAAWLAGARSPDPWYQYNGAGNTGSLMRGGIAISESQINDYCKTHYVGVIYGHSIWDTTHIVAAKNSTTLYSHGRDAGPEIVRSIHYHPNPVVGIRAYTVI